LRISLYTPGAQGGKGGESKEAGVTQGGGEERGGEGGGEGGEGGSTKQYYYRSKAILAFRCLPGSVADALTFAMYVHEFGLDAPPAYRRKVLLECFDGVYVCMHIYIYI